MIHCLFAAVLALTSAQQARIDAIVALVMREHHVMGLSLGVARAGTRLYLRGYGVRDSSKRGRADGETVYAVGSIAKQFTAALVLQSAARGRLALDASATAYLPQFAGLSKVTVAGLLSQTAGIDAAADLENPSPRNPPGTQWSYANANYALLGMLLERATGTGFEALVRRDIAAPLGLQSTGCMRSPSAQNAAMGYAWAEAGGWSAPLASATTLADRACSASGIFSNARDLLTWLEALRSGRVTGAAAFATMTSSALLSNGTPANYGYGFFISNWYGYRVAQHSGYVDGFSSIDAIVPRDGTEIVVLSNENAVDLEPLAKALLAILDAPLDRNLSPGPGAPQNENAGITAALQSILKTPGFAPLGELVALEFIERNRVRDVTYDKYRATFSRQQTWVTIGYTDASHIVSLSVQPIE